MLNLLHTFEPNRLLISFGSINIYWYGFFIFCGMILAGTTVFILFIKHKLPKEDFFDLFFWLIITGIIGARIYHVFLDYSYYFSYPIEILKIWKGGLAIHGGLIAGFITILIFSRRNKINFWKITSLAVPGLALAQALGRWGNYFNQELFGKPTNLPWGIPINPVLRPPEYFFNNYFHPTFLYESLGSLIIFFILIGLHIWIIKKNKRKDIYFQLITINYLIFYSLLRFSLEFIRIDATPVVWGLRFPQLASLIIISFCAVIMIKNLKRT